MPIGTRIGRLDGRFLIGRTGRGARRTSAARPTPERCRRDSSPTAGRVPAQTRSLRPTHGLRLGARSQRRRSLRRMTARSTTSGSRRSPATSSGSRPRSATPCRADDRFLGEVAGHLLERRRQAAPARRSPSAPRTPSTGAGGPRHDDAVTGGVGGRARAPRLALPRRRDRRGRDPPRRAERERALVQHRRDPRRRLPARAGVGARGVARRRRRRRCSPRRSASCAAARCSSCSTSSTSTAARSRTSPRSRARPRR